MVDRRISGMPKRLAFALLLAACAIPPTSMTEQDSISVCRPVSLCNWRLSDADQYCSQAVCGRPAHCEPTDDLGDGVCIQITAPPVAAPQTTCAMVCDVNSDCERICGPTFKCDPRSDYSVCVARTALP